MTGTETLGEGDELPPYAVLLTLQRLVMAAGSSRDFSPIHFDREAGRATGAQDAYANTILLETLLEACVRSWAGPAARIRALAIRMLSFNCVGDRIAARGVVREVPADGRTAALELWIESHRGVTVRASATVEFPMNEAEDR